MPKTKRKPQERKNVLSVSALLVVCGIVLFKSFIWDEYIVNSTAWAALEGREGEVGVGYAISKKQELAIKPFKDGFKIYAVSKGFFGWTVTDEEFVGNKENEFYEIGELDLQFNPSEKLYLNFVLDQDEYFEKIKAYSPGGIEIGFNRSVGNDVFFYYHYSDKHLGDVMYEGIRSNGSVEKLK
ncbi:hypothetical protein [Sporosarcina sp. FSL W7-1283]|uniref:hypothetical protein n=1 Tax=Sporosarcina sp. FSL W7-1283 TaxID=2921560 RepID=UPI0030FB5B49